MSRMEIFGIEGIGEIRVGDDLAAIIHEAASSAADTVLADGDVLVVTQKIVSKAEDRLVAIDPNYPLSHKPLVERESVRILRRRGDLIISETEHGFICANAGIDLSNVESGWAALLPVDSDRSARRIRDGLRHLPEKPLLLSASVVNGAWALRPLATRIGSLAESASAVLESKQSMEGQADVLCLSTRHKNTRQWIAKHHRYDGRLSACRVLEQSWSAVDKTSP